MARRMVSETTIKNKQGEVIINNAMTVAKNGDVVVGKNLEVDGALTVGGEPITPGGGGGSKLYKHSVQIGSDQVSSGVIQFNFISASDEPVVEPESFESKLYKAIAPFTVNIPYYDDDLGADCELRYIGDTFYLTSDGTTAFNVGDYTHENLYGILVNVNFMTEQTEFKLDARVYEVLGITDTVTAL